LFTTINAVEEMSNWLEQNKEYYAFLRKEQQAAAAAKLVASQTSLKRPSAAMSWDDDGVGRGVESAELAGAALGTNVFFDMLKTRKLNTDVSASSVGIVVPVYTAQMSLPVSMKPDGESSTASRTVPSSVIGASSSSSLMSLPVASTSRAVITEPTKLVSIGEAFSNALVVNLGEGVPFIKRLQTYHSETWGDDIAQAWSAINTVACQAFANGIRVTTQESYRSGIVSYEFFCEQMKLTAYPATEETLIAYVVWSSRRISAQSMSNYLSAVRSAHLSRDAEWKPRSQMPRLLRVLSGFEWLKRAEKEGRVRLPLTFDLVKQVLLKKTEDEVKDSKKATSIYSLASACLTAALYSTGLTGVLRPSEFVVRKTGQGVVTPPLRIKHLRWGHRSHVVRNVTLSLAKRKTEQMGERCDIVMGVTGDDIVCAPTWLDRMFKAREAEGEVLTGESYLFAVKDEKGIIRPLDYDDLTKMLRADLEACGIDGSKYAGHSFRIGAATTLSQNLCPTFLIEAMGGWTPGSRAFPLYNRADATAIDRETMAQFFSKPYVRLPDEKCEYFAWPAVEVD
jgi:hypothetical protein